MKHLATENRARICMYILHVDFLLLVHHRSLKAKPSFRIAEYYTFCVVVLVSR